MLHHFFITEIKLYKVKVTFPALIPEAVIIIGIPVKAYMEPVLIGRIPAVFKHILKLIEAPSHMVKDSVQYNLDPLIMKRITNLLKILIRAEPHIDLRIITRVIPMGVRLEKRGKINRIAVKLFDLGDKIKNLQYPVL